jgi:hypothetical protein
MTVYEIRDGRSAILVRDDLPYQGKTECKADDRWDTVQGKGGTGYWHNILNIILLFTIRRIDIKFFLVCI